MPPAAGSVPPAAGSGRSDDDQADRGGPGVVRADVKQAGDQHVRVGHAAGGRRTVVLLLVMTSLTGLVDSVTYLGLGQVFVANMTGNVALLGFAVAGAEGISAVLSATALGCFLLGALAGGRVGARLASSPRWWLGAVTAGQAVLMAGALAVTAGWLGDVLAASAASSGRGDLTGPVVRGATPADALSPGPAQYAIVSMLAVAMGLQHATARQLARPDIPTNVLTTALTTFVTQTRLGGGRGSGGARRLAGPTVMFGSACTGAFCFLQVAPLLPLCAGLGLVLLGVAVATLRRPLPGRVSGR